MKFDDRTRRNALQLYPAFAILVLRVFQETTARTGIAMSLAQGYRNFGEQQNEFDKGRSKPGPGVSATHPMGRIVTNARPGQTVHNYGLGADGVFEQGDGYTGMPWDAFDQVAQEKGLKTGASFKKIVDRDHLEKTWGLQIIDLQKLYKSGGLTMVWERLDRVREVPAGEGWRSEKLLLQRRLGEA